MGRFVSLLNEVDLVSFDVFDTALVRGLVRPVDLFIQLAIEAHARGLLTTEQSNVIEFRRARETAENEARRLAWEAHQWVEITLEEIYAQLGSILGLDKIGSQSLMALEQELELAHAIKNDYIGALYDLAMGADKRVGFISDMYLGEHCVRGMLDRAGYSDYEFLCVSSVTRETKASGTLYKKIHKDLGVSFGRWLHVGDNLGSDVKQAQALGIRALHYEKCTLRMPRERILQRRLSFHPHPDATTNYDLFKSIVGGLIAARQFVEPDPPSKAKPGDVSFWETWGYRHAGPLLAGFGSWLVREMGKRQFRDAYFLSRDGYLIKEIVDRLTQVSVDAKPAIQTHYLYASRRAFNLAAITELSEENLNFLVSGTSRMSPRQFLARIDINIDLYLDVVARVGFGSPDDVIVDGPGYGRLRALLRDLGEHILARAVDEFETLSQYFREQGLLDGGEVAIIDLGWHGSLQHSMENLLSRMGASTVMTGYYMGTFPAARRYIDRGHELCGYLCEEGKPDELYAAIKLSVEVFEWIFSAPHGSVCNFKLDELGIHPVFADFDFEDARWECAAAMQSGALSFIDDYVRVLGGQLLPDVPPDAALQLLHAALLEPTLQEARLIGDLQHAEGFGSVAVTRYIARPEGSIWNPLSYPALVRGYRDAFWRAGYLTRLGLSSVVRKKWFQ
ncbi:MAG: hypothetical protein IPG66_16005 [Hydrogenophilales bacterium]|nr:hypothetical protein [Hydrogenophilales bacterium]